MNENVAGAKLTPVPNVPLAFEALTRSAVVVPPYFGRLAVTSEPCVSSRPNTNIRATPDRPSPASTVTILWKRRVGWTTITSTTASTSSAPTKPQPPVIPSLVANQWLARSKKPQPVPIPTIRPVICRLRRTIGTSNATIDSDATTSVNDSSQPRNGPALGISRVVNT